MEGERARCRKKEREESEREVRRGTNEVSHLDNSPVKFIETQVNPPLFSPHSPYPPVYLTSPCPPISLILLPSSLHPPLSSTLTSSCQASLTLTVSIRSLFSSTHPLFPTVSFPCPLFPLESPCIPSRVPSVITPPTTTTMHLVF